MAYVERAGDDFERTGPLGTEWDPATELDAVSLPSAVGLELVGNAVQAPAGAVTAASIYNGVTLPANQWAEVRVASTIPDYTVEQGLLVRADALGGTCYMGMARTNTTNVFRIARNNSGIRTPIASATTPAFVGGEVLLLEVTGDTITLSMDGTPVLITSHTSIPSGTRAGLINSPNAGDETVVVLDDFRCGDFGVATGGIVRQMILHGGG